MNDFGKAELAKPEAAKKPPNLPMSQVVQDSNALMSTDRRQPMVIKMKVVNPSVGSEDNVAPTNKAGSANFNVPSTMNSTNRDLRGSIQRPNQALSPSNNPTSGLSVAKSQSPGPARPIFTLNQHPLDSFVDCLVTEVKRLYSHNRTSTPKAVTAISAGP